MGNEKIWFKSKPFKITLCLFIALVIILVTIFGLYQYKEKIRYKTYLANSYEKSFHEVAGYLSNISSMLKKAEIIERPEQASAIYANIWRQASSAHGNLSMLPYNHETVIKIIEYLSQLSGLSYAMMEKSIEGTLLSATDHDNITLAQKYAEWVSGELYSIINTANLSGGIDWSLLSGEAYPGENTEALEPTGSLANIAKGFRDYPVLIYGGAFGHTQNAAPKILENKPAISIDDGFDIVESFLSGFNIKELEFIGETHGHNIKIIPVYSYAAVLENETEPTIYIDITKNGGFPLWMLSTKKTAYSGVNISLDDALLYAGHFLEKNQFENMRYSFYEYYENYAVISYAPYIGGIIMYPDLVKVKVSLVDGTILGFEALGYVQWHYERNIPDASFSQAEALMYISPSLNIESINMAIIPKPSGKEELCYEYGVENETGGKFLIYINAITGKMEDMFELVINEHGFLAQ